MKPEDIDKIQRDVFLYVVALTVIASVAGLLVWWLG